MNRRTPAVSSDARCGNLITGESVIKKATGKQYVYYRCSVSRLGDHPRHRVTESGLDDQILAPFQRMKQDEETAAWFGEGLRTRTTYERKETQSKRGNCNGE